MVTGMQITIPHAVDPQACRTAQQHNPLIMVLIEGRILQRNLTVGDDPLDPDPRPRQ